MEPAEPKWRRLRISLRVLMLLVLGAAVWMGSIVNKVQNQREAVAAVKEYGGQVSYNWQFARPKLTEPPAPKWLRRLVGDEYFQTIEHVDLVENRWNYLAYEPKRVHDPKKILARIGAIRTLGSLVIKDLEITDESLDYLRHLYVLQILIIGNSTKITEKGIAHLEPLTELTHVDIMQSRLNDDCLNSFAKLPKLRSLGLGGKDFTDAGLFKLKDSVSLRHLCVGDGKRRITDGGLVHLANLKNLQSLSLQNTEVTDAGLVHLRGLTKLKEIAVRGTRITEEGIARFKAAMPKVRINR